MSKPVLIGDFLHRIKRPINLEPASRYKLVTVKLYHKGVVLREEKLGADIKSKMYQVKEGDFILSGIDARNGAFGIVPPELDGAVVTNDFWYFEIDDDVVDKGFFLEITSTHWFDEICRKGSDGTTQRIRLQKDKFFNQIIYLPDLSEQRRFNKKFQAIKASNKTLSSELTHQHTLLKKLRQQILQEAIQGKLTTDWRAQNPDVEPASELLKRIAAEKAQLVKEKKIKAQKPLPPITDEEKPFELPQGWEWCRLGEIASLKSGNQYQYPKANSGVMFVKVGDMNADGNDYQIITSSTYFQSDKVRQQDLIPCGSIIFPKRGGAIATNKRRVVFQEPILVDSNTMAVIPFSNVNFSYFKFWFDSVDLALLGNDSVVPQVNNKDLNPLVIALPPLNEQIAIVTKVEKLLALCDQLETQITHNQSHAEQLMQTVLKEAFAHNSEAESEAQNSTVSADTPEVIRA